MKVFVVYVNPIEYHGAHLPLKTDYEISRGLLREFTKRVHQQNPSVEFLVKSEIHLGCDPAPGPGSEYTTLADLRKQVLLVCEPFRVEKPDLVLFLTFHGAPKHAAAIQTGVEFLEKNGVRAYNPFNFLFQRMLDFKPEWAKPAADLIPDREFAQHWLERVPEDFHGGLFETSVLMSLDPSQVLPIYRELPDCPDRKVLPDWFASVNVSSCLPGFLRVKKNEWAIIVDALLWNQQKPHLGYTSAPRFASVEIGQYFVNFFLNDYVEGFWDILNHGKPSPKPALQWTTVL